MTLEQSHIGLISFCHKFLIVGYKYNGIRGIPVKHEWVIESAFDEDDVCNKIKGLIEFKVFSIEEGSFSSDQWIILSNRKSQEATEKEEKELLEQLKAKYE